MNIETVFYTQIVSIFAFTIMLFGLYRLLVSAKDATIEGLKQHIDFLERKIQDLNEVVPDVLLQRMAKRMTSLEKELEVAESEKDPLIAEIESLKHRLDEPGSEAQRETKSLELKAVSDYATSLENERDQLRERIQEVEDANAKMLNVEAQLAIVSQRAESLENELLQLHNLPKEAMETEARNDAVSDQLAKAKIRTQQLESELEYQQYRLHNVAMGEGQFLGIQAKLNLVSSESDRVEAHMGQIRSALKRLTETDSKQNQWNTQLLELTKQATTLAEEKTQLAYLLENIKNINHHRRMLERHNVSAGERLLKEELK